MEWADIRAELKRAYAAAKRRGMTQKHAGARAGIRQGQISRTLSNKHLGPTVGTFAKAVEGCGLSLAQFFANLERRSRGEIAESEPMLQGSYAKTTIVKAPGTFKSHILDVMIDALVDARQRQRRPGRRVPRKRAARS
jgi:transcriptional regulator with XRE-family HTH domain